MPKPIEFDQQILNRAAPKAFRNVTPRRDPDIRIENKGDSATIRIYDAIGPDWAGMIGAETVARALDSAGDVKTISLRINSPGGDVFEGLAIYNQVVNHPATVNITIDGIAASIVSVIAMAGDSVSIAKNGQVMIHPPAGMVFGGAADMRALADVLDAIQSSITGVYMDRTGREEAELTEWINAETYMTAEEAVERGFADSIIENKSGGKKPDDSGNEKPKNETHPAIKARNRRRVIELEGIEI